MRLYASTVQSGLHARSIVAAQRPHSQDAADLISIQAWMDVTAAFEARQCHVKEPSHGILICTSCRFLCVLRVLTSAY